MHNLPNACELDDPRTRAMTLPTSGTDDPASLGERLALPEGWAYVTPKLERDLTLTAQGSATVMRDDLQNTYQRRS